MNCACPHCGEPVEVSLTAVAPKPRTVEVAEAYLQPCVIADRLGIGEAYTRKLINRGLRLDEPGFEKRGGRLFATVEAVKSLR